MSFRRCCGRRKADQADLGVPFRRLEESGIVTRCEITTYEPDTLMDLSFDDETRVQKLIMKVRSSRCLVTPLLLAALAIHLGYRGGSKY